MLYAKSGSEFSRWFKALTYASEYTLDTYYDVADVIGVGGFASVRFANEKGTGKPVAVKSIKKDSASSLLMQREITVLRSVNHPRLVRTFDIFDTEESYHIVMELMKGGMLFDEMNRRPRFSEPDTRYIIKQVLAGVAYLHSVGVVHRDLKPENILMTSRHGLDIKLADFGLSNILTGSDSVMKTLLGTPQFIAPEVVQASQYDEVVDVWAIGMIMYNLLTGILPFTEKQVFDKYRMPDLKVPFRKRKWKFISPQAQSLTRQMLCTDPSKRVSALAALNHPWITNNQTKECYSSTKRPTVMFRRAVHCVRFLLRLGSKSGQFTSLNFQYVSLCKPGSLVTLESSEYSVTSLANSDWDFEVEKFSAEGVQSIDNWGNTTRNVSNMTQKTAEQKRQEFLARMARGLALLQTTNERATVRSNAGATTRSNNGPSASPDNHERDSQVGQEQRVSGEELEGMTTGHLTNHVVDVASVRSLQLDAALGHAPVSIPTTPVTYNFDSRGTMRNSTLGNNTIPNSTILKSRHGAKLKHWLLKAFRPHHIQNEIARKDMDQS